MALSQTATLTRDFSKLDQHTPFTPQKLTPLPDSQYHSAGDATRVDELTRPKVRRRGNSVAIPTLATPSTLQPHQHTSPRPRTSDGQHSPVQLLSPTQSSATSYFAARPNTGGDLRSPSFKRQPASRSCHGVATSAGPPPALSTQRALSYETTRNPCSKDNFGVVYPNLTPNALAQLDAANSTQSPKEEKAISQRQGESELRGIRNITSSPEENKDRGMVGTISDAHSDTNMDRDRKRSSLEGSRLASQRLSAHLNNADLMPQDVKSDKSSQEDLFLNLAHADDETVNGNQEQRKSRIAVAANRLSLHRPQISEPSSRERRSSLKRPEFTTDYRTPPSTDRMSSKDRPYAESAHPLGHKYGSRFSGGLRVSPASRTAEQSPNDSPSAYVKRRSDVPSYQSRNRSSLHQEMMGNYISYANNDRKGSLDQEPSPPLSKALEGTESTISTTAPSTVWDELENLKSRMRKFELMNGVPTTSSAAMSTATERPQTAGTAATTISSSPKRNRGGSASPSTPGSEGPTPHPLLVSALEKAKPSITIDTYRALEATASDAVTLAKMASSSSGTPQSAIDRQLKRKADNMCRSLTELCIALSKGGPTELERPKTRARSGSRDGVVLHQPKEQEQSPELRYQRASSLDPEQTTTQRALSRLEARRTSLLHNANPANSSGQNSPLADRYPDVKTPTQATLDRTSTVLQRIRRGNEMDADSTIRPLSRATTEISRANTTGGIGNAAKRVSREYTSNHPLPSPGTRTFAAQSHLPARRSYLSGSAVAMPSASGRDKELPATPTTAGFSSRRFLSSQTNEGTGIGRNASRLAEGRQSRIVSAGQYGELSGGRSVLTTRADRRSVIGGVSGDVQGE